MAVTYRNMNSRYNTLGKRLIALRLRELHSHVTYVTALLKFTEWTSLQHVCKFILIQLWTNYDTKHVAYRVIAINQICAREVRMLVAHCFLLCFVCLFLSDGFVFLQLSRVIPVINRPSSCITVWLPQRSCKIRIRKLFRNIATLLTK